MSKHRESKLWTSYLVMGVLLYWCVLYTGTVCAASSAQSSFLRNRRKLAEIHRHLAEINKPAVKSIKVLSFSMVSLFHCRVALVFWVLVRFEHFL